MAMAYRLMIDDLHDALAAQGWTDVRESYGFVLLAIRPGDATVTELARLLGVSKQATSKLLDGMEESGYVTRHSAEHDGRAKSVSIAPRGHELLAAVEAIYRTVESTWADVIGQTALDQTRSRLERVLRSRYGNDLPHLRPT